MEPRLGHNSRKFGSGCLTSLFPVLIPGSEYLAKQ
jgi:hypothetical protein